MENSQGKATCPHPTLWPENQRVYVICRPLGEVSMAQSFDEPYRALTDQAGVVDFSGRTRIEARGDDRASFLHNLSTNEVKSLQPGQGCEAFFLDARGHVMGHGFLLCRPRSIVIETVGGQNERLLKHLDRYLIREKVELADRTAEWGELLLAGAKSREVLSRFTAEPPENRLASTECQIDGHAATVVRVEMTPVGGFLILCGANAREAIEQAIVSAGAVVCEPASLEAARIEAGFPWYGQDVTDKNLPQEVGRDELAISFKKGCYIGQETVARIDALGHVNKKLARVRFTSRQAPPPGTELRAGEQAAGQVTSAAYSPRHDAALALAYLRRGSDAPHSELSSDFGQAVILPA
jgi:folate-binding protein YgfZ